jgi:hypothetical protein
MFILPMPEGIFMKNIFPPAVEFEKNPIGAVVKPKVFPVTFTVPLAVAAIP